MPSHNREQNVRLWDFTAGECGKAWPCRTCFFVRRGQAPFLTLRLRDCLISRRWKAVLVKIIPRL